MTFFRSAVFSGGGNRCLWQVGFWKEASSVLSSGPEVVVGVSAGATMACIIMADRIDFAMEFGRRVMGANHRNVYWRNIWGPGDVFPHYRIYRRLILETFDDDALERLWSGPEIRVVLARPPRPAGSRGGVVLGISTYLLEKSIFHPVHPRWTQKLGFRPEVVSVKECRDAGQLADLLISSSCTPPFVPVMHWKGGPVLDGGLIDNVPVFALNDAPGPTLVLLTRQYRSGRVPRVPGRYYVQPTLPIGINKWDYTDPEGMQEAFDQGRRDGERFARYIQDNSDSGDQTPRSGI